MGKLLIMILDLDKLLRLVKNMLDILFNFDKQPKLITFNK